MNKQEFLIELKNRLNGLPDQDLNRSIEFYSEMIDDRIEEGLSEEAAVLEIGDVEEIVSQIIADTPITKILKEKIKPKKKLGVFEIILLVLGSPIWLSLLIAAFAVIFALYVSFWAILISLWAVFASLVGCGIGGIVSGIAFICLESQIAGVAIIGASIICLGLSVFAFFVFKSATKGIILLTKKIAFWIKSLFIKKEEV